jgi:anti-sigma factor RsiW
MTAREHERALDLIMRRGTEEIVEAESAWLNSHLATCAECAQYVDDFDNTGRLLRAVAVTASPSLVQATQTRVRARALHMQEQRSRNVLIAISFCIGAMSSTMSAWLWWRFGGWVAQRMALPPSLVEPGVFVAWMLPAVVIAVAMLASSHPVIDRSLTMSALGRSRKEAANDRA